MKDWRTRKIVVCRALDAHTRLLLSQASVVGEQELGAALQAKLRQHGKRRCLQTDNSGLCPAAKGPGPRECRNPGKVERPFAFVDCTDRDRPQSVEARPGRVRGGKGSRP